MVLVWGRFFSSRSGSRHTTFEVHEDIVYISGGRGGVVFYATAACRRCGAAAAKCMFFFELGVCASWAEMNQVVWRLLAVEGTGGAGGCLLGDHGTRLVAS